MTVKKLFRDQTSRNLYVAELGFEVATPALQSDMPHDCAMEPGYVEKTKNTAELRWLEHLWDHRKLFEPLRVN